MDSWPNDFRWNVFWPNVTDPRQTNKKTCLFILIAMSVCKQHDWRELSCREFPGKSSQRKIEKSSYITEQLLLHLQQLGHVIVGQSNKIFSASIYSTLELKSSYLDQNCHLTWKKLIRILKSQRRVKWDWKYIYRNVTSWSAQLTHYLELLRSILATTNPWVEKPKQSC